MYRQATISRAATFVATVFTAAHGVVMAAAGCVGTGPELTA